MKKFHPLMQNNITKDDLNQVIKFLNKEPILTQSKKVMEFEHKWSKWLGVKYSVFVNSGSSANYLTFLALKYLYGGGGEVLVPTLTWVSDIVSVAANNFKIKFVDINLKNLCMDERKILASINSKTKAIFFTHAQGFNGYSNNLIKILKKKKIILIEDVCESHGAVFNKKKIGSFGLMSNFSFYYAHHLSTIEGGMICTNNKKIYEVLRMLRSHGMAREVSDQSINKKFQNKYKDLSPNFIFAYPAFNMRNNEISAVLGINQLKRLDTNNKKRAKNLSIFLENLDSTKYITNFDLEGNSNYAFPLILKNSSIKLRNKLEKLMYRNSIEFRRGNAGGGNQVRQPYLKHFGINLNPKKFKNCERIHFFGYYIGNFPDLHKARIIEICNILNTL